MLGAGELGLPLLRNFARRAQDAHGAKISVLLRASAVESSAPGKREDIAGIRGLGIEIVVDDAVHALGSLDTAVTLTTPDDIGALCVVSLSRCPDYLTFLWLYAPCNPKTSYNALTPPLTSMFRP